MNQPNPLQHAIDIYDHLLDAEGEMMYRVAGKAAFDPWDDALYELVVNLVFSSAEAANQLPPRARRARLNLIWKDFVKNQQQLKGEPI